MIARDGEEALAIARERVPDIIVLDIRMPKLGGDEVLRRVRREPRLRRIPVVILSAYADDRSRESCLELGADEYVTRPFSPADLVRRVEAVLEGKAEDQSKASRQRGERGLDLSHSPLCPLPT